MLELLSRFKLSLDLNLTSVQVGRLSILIHGESGGVFERRDRRPTYLCFRVFNEMDKSWMKLTNRFLIEYKEKEFFNF